MTTFLYTDPIEISTTTTLKFVAVDSQGNVGAIQTEEYVIEGFAADLVVAPTLTEANLIGVLSTASISITIGLDSASLVGILPAGGMVVSPAFTEAELTGGLPAENISLPITITPALLVALSGSGSIRSPSGATLRRASNSLAILRRFISGSWR